MAEGDDATRGANNSPSHTHTHKRSFRNSSNSSVATTFAGSFDSTTSRWYTQRKEESLPAFVLLARSCQLLKPLEKNDYSEEAPHSSRAASFRFHSFSMCAPRTRRAKLGYNYTNSIQMGKQDGSRCVWDILKDDSAGLCFWFQCWWRGKNANTRWTIVVTWLVVAIKETARLNWVPSIFILLCSG